jgi:cellulose synthase/poly-beta-1,6-N-acetylglucosamine synthase-like glycosyltransferase
MIILWQIIFWTSILLILHSYVVFPLFLTFFSKKRELTEYSRKEELPFVSILMSIYNEELVISEKIESILASNYPKDKYEIIIGSDCSDDKSNEIVSKFSEQYNFITLLPYTERQGKPNVINQIFEHSKGEIIILTDANVMFDENAIFELVKYFKNEGIGLVDSQMINKGIVKDGISVQESSYISREVKIKSNESNIWGTMMGPFGGCYAIRRELYQPVPKNFLVDDFYINMKILEQGFKSINNTKAHVFEDVSNNLFDEFKRKIRIATGNFQNLSTFKHLLFYGLGIRNKKIAKKTYFNSFGLSFSFFSHKVSRWIIPFFILLIAISGIFLIKINLYLIIYIGFLSSLILPLLDYILKKIKINIPLLRFITHFYSMNLALFIGFFRFIKGVKSGIWKPTKRNQTQS